MTMAMKKELKLTPNQKKLVKRLNKIVEELEKEGVGMVIQTRCVDFDSIRFYNAQNVVWSDVDEVEVGISEEMDKEEIESFSSNNNLQVYDKLTWCCPDSKEMYSIPFIFFDGKAPNPYIPIEDREVFSIVLRKSSEKYDFKEGLAPVMNDEGNWGYIDKKGRIVIPYEWTLAYEFSEGLALVADNTIRFGYINKKGELVIPCEWNIAFDFSDGLAVVGNEFNISGFINKKGELVIPCKWKIALPFTNGLASVMDEDGNWYTIDKLGNVVSIEESNYD